MKRRIISMLLALALVLSVLPANILVPAKAAVPDAPTNPHWDGYVAKWDAVPGAATYQVALWCGSFGIAKHETLNTQYDLSSYMAPGQTYEFSVYTVNGDGKSVDATSSSITVPGTLGTISGITWNGYKVSWNPVADAVSYNVKLMKNNIQVATVNAQPGTECDFEDEIESNGAGAYSAKITADYVVFGNTMASGKSGYIDQNGNAVTEVDTITATLSVPVAGQTGSSMTLTVPEGSHYTATIKRIEGYEDLSATTFVAGESYSARIVVTPNEGYKFASSATVQINNTAYASHMSSNTATGAREYAVAFSCPSSAPAAPTNLRWEGNVAKWDAVAGAEKYQVSLWIGTGMVYSCEVTTASADFSKYLLPGNTYDFAVRAVVADIGSDFSDWSPKITIPGTWGTVDNIQLNGYTLSWDSVTNAEGYFIQVFRGSVQVDGISIADAATEYDLSRFFAVNGAGTYSFTVSAQIGPSFNVLAKGDLADQTVATVPTFITNVAVSGVTAPNSGGTAATSPTFTLPAGADYVIASSAWMHNNGDKMASSETFEAGSIYLAEFVLAPKSGFVFPEDSSDVTATINGSAPAVMFMDNNGNLTIRIQLLAPAVGFDISASASPAEGGTITGTGNHEQYTYASLTATPNPGYVFWRWMENGSYVNSSNPYSVWVSENRAFVAEFLKLIPSVAVTGFTVPAAGTHTNDIDDPAGSIVSGNGYTLITSYWADAEGIQWSGTFEAGQTYYATFTLRADDGFVFPGTGFTATVNGDNAYSVDVSNSYRENDQVQVVVQFTVPSAGGGTIDTVELSGVITPVGGTTGSVDPTATIPSGANYAIGSSEWLDSFSVSVNDNIIVAGKTYYASFRLEAAEGYLFAEKEDMTVTINGKPADVVRTWTNKNTLTVAIKLVATGIVIDSITLTDVASPIIGNTGSVDPTATIPSGANYAIGSSEWLDSYGVSVNNDYFVAGESYYASFELIPTAAYVFPESREDLTVTINGKPADVVVVNGDGNVNVRILLPVSTGIAATMSDVDFGTVVSTDDAFALNPTITNTGSANFNLGGAFAKVVLTDGDTDAFTCGWNGGGGAMTPGDSSSSKPYVWYKEGLMAGTYTATLSLYYDFDGASGENYGWELVATCTVTVTVEEPHEHTYSNYSYDANNHWKVCSDPNCPDPDGSKIELDTHDFADSQDLECDTCGYEKEFALTVIGGQGGGLYHKGDIIDIEANVPEGYIFEKWVVMTPGAVVSITNDTSAITSLVMPGYPVTIGAVFGVTSATAAVTTQPIGGEAPYGSKYTVTWETNFTPVKAVLYKFNPLSGVDDTELTDPTVTTLALDPVANGGYYWLRLYYSDTEYLSTDDIYVTEADPIIIDSVDVTITAPVNGSKPSYNASVPDDAPYTVKFKYTDGYTQGVIWEVNGEWMHGSTSFATGNAYTFTVLIQAKEGCEFQVDGSGLDLDVTVNGISENVIYHYYDMGNKIIQVQYTFTLDRKIITQPVSGEAPYGGTYTVEWETNFTPVKVVLVKFDAETGSNFKTTTVTLDDPTVTSVDLAPTVNATGYYYFKLYYTETDYLFTDDIYVSEADPIIIDSVDVTITAPVDGAKPSYDASVPSDAPYTVKFKYTDNYTAGVMWEIGSQWVHGSTAFVVGQAYTFTVLIQAKEGCEFQVDGSGLDLNVTVNGISENVIYHYYDMGNKIIQVQYTFIAKPSYVYGDANNSGSVTAEDADLVKQYRAGLIDSTALNLDACDVSGDGKVDAYDAYLIQLFVAGQIDTFPCES